jgi:hypothetical protein
MLKFLRRRVRLIRRALGLAVGYTEGHLCRLEQDRRPPDVAMLKAPFTPALGLDTEPGLAARLLKLAIARAAWSPPWLPSAPCSFCTTSTPTGLTSFLSMPACSVSQSGHHRPDLAASRRRFS